MKRKTYRPCPIKRARRSKVDIDSIKQAIIDVIEDDPPMTVRQVFYQLVTRGKIEKTEAQYHQVVIRLMTKMHSTRAFLSHGSLTKVVGFGSRKPTTALPMPSSAPPSSIAVARSRRLPIIWKFGARRMPSPGPYGT